MYNIYGKQLQFNNYISIYSITNGHFNKVSRFVRKWQTGKEILQVVVSFIDFWFTMSGIVDKGYPFMPSRFVKLREKSD